MPEHLVKLALLALNPADQMAKWELDYQPESEADHELIASTASISKACASSRKWSSEYITESP
jgi:hypothetical protein